MKLFIKAVEARNEAEIFKLEKLVIFGEGFNNKNLALHNSSVLYEFFEILFIFKKVFTTASIFSTK